MSEASRVAANDNSEHRFYVYAWQYPDGRTFYVGKGHGRRDRDEATGRNRFFRAIVAKIRRQDGEPRIVRWHDRLTEDDAHRLEMAYIKLFGRRDLWTGTLCNLTNGGEGEGGRVLSAEHRAKIGAASSNRSAETRAKISAANTGRKHTAEQRAKIARALLGRPKSATAVAKLRKSKLGIPLSEEHRAKLRAANLGKTASAETREKIGAAHRGATRSQETRDKMSLARRMLGPLRGEFKGVSFVPSLNKWRANISSGNARRCLGDFSRAEDAALAYDRAAIATWGLGNCYLNFPEDVAA